MSLIDDKWEILFEKYKIREEIREKGRFFITADQIREVKEPRLMTKFDTRESRPEVFGRKIGILPVTRGSYVLGEFDLYQDFPDTWDSGGNLAAAKIPDYFETIDINDIRSEAGAIHVMGLAGILDDFLGERDMKQTVSGRMGSGSFAFQVRGSDRKSVHQIEVRNSQVEIDGGFESRNAFAVIEGKNVVHSNFLIRQLYYPARLWQERIRKKVRPVFMVYSNNIFRLLEYEFTDIRDYSSLKLVREKSYSLEDIEISLEDLNRVFRETKPEPESKVTFIQANSFPKVISLAEHLNSAAMTRAEIAELFGFRLRQSDYYFNACKYLGLAEKRTGEDGVKKVYITPLGKRLLKLKYKERQLEYACLILKHPIFHELFELVLRTGQIPDQKYVVGRMRALELCGESLLDRRASSVRRWLAWMYGLVSVF